MSMSSAKAVSRPALNFSAVAAALVALGLVMVFSASSYRSVHVTGDPYLWFGRQAYWAALAVLCLILTALPDYRRILKLWPVFFTASILGLCLVFLPPIGRRYNEAARWLSIGTYVLQPSEFAKLSVVICLAGFLGERRSRVNDFFHTFVPLMAGVSACFILILVEPDLGTAAFVFGLALVIMLVAGVSVWYLGLAGVLASPAFALFAYFKWEKIIERFRGVADPSAKYQVLQSLIALGSGGLWGKGLGGSTQKMGFLPEPFTDFIFSILGEELGFVGCAAVILLFAMLAVFGLRIAFRAPDFGGFLLAFGATFSIVLQAVINIAVVTGSAPTKGISLPFVSYGGSGLVLAFAAVGLVLNVAWRSAGAAGAEVEVEQEHEAFEDEALNEDRLEEEPQEQELQEEEFEEEEPEEEEPEGEEEPEEDRLAEECEVEGGEEEEQEEKEESEEMQEENREAQEEDREELSEVEEESGEGEEIEEQEHPSRTKLVEKPRAPKKLRIYGRKNRR